MQVAVEDDPLAWLPLRLAARRQVALLGSVGTHDPQPVSLRAVVELAAFVVHAEQEPSAVGRDVRLELEDAFEVEDLAKGRAIGAGDVRSVGAGEDDAPAGQLARDRVTGSLASPPAAVRVGSRIRVTKVRLAFPTLPVTCQHPAVGKVIAVD